MASHNELGKWGEMIAGIYLRQQGYVILHRDWKSGHRDIDIVARDGDVLVFVEVKTRRDNIFGSPIEAVDGRKLRNLRLAINHYLNYYRINGEARFDIVSVVGQVGDASPSIEHLKNLPLY